MCRWMFAHPCLALRRIMTKQTSNRGQISMQTVPFSEFQDERDKVGPHHITLLVPQVDQVQTQALYGPPTL